MTSSTHAEVLEPRRMFAVVSASGANVTDEYGLGTTLVELPPDQFARVQSLWEAEDNLERQLDLTATTTIGRNGSGYTLLNENGQVVGRGFATDEHPFDGTPRYRFMTFDGVLHRTAFSQKMLEAMLPDLPNAATLDQVAAADRPADGDLPLLYHYRPHTSPPVGVFADQHDEPAVALDFFAEVEENIVSVSIGK